MEFSAIKGTHDVIIDEANAYTEIEDLFKAVATVYGYNEFRTPVFEACELFARNQGDSSDVVRKQMYTFEDKGGRLLTLRPELTAGIVRSMINNKLFIEQDYPVKAYYCGEVFRYERPKTGTYRQFEQCGIESLGLDSPYADVETILMAARYLRMLGFENITLKINTLGDEESRNNYREALREYFKPHLEKMCPDCHERYELNPLRILDCKVPFDQEIVKNAPKMSDYLTPAAKERFYKTLDILAETQTDYVVDHNLVRGLDYYSHVVFEFSYITKDGRDIGALGGGGHYDKLCSELGGPCLAGVGFAFGMERIYTVMKEDNIKLASRYPFDFYVMPMSENEIDLAFSVCDYLRLLGFRSEVSLEKRSFKSLFKKAQKRNAKFAIIIGENERINKEVVIKNMDTQQQETIPLNEIDVFLDKAFGEEEHECHCHDGECECGHDHEEGHECCCHHKEGK